MSLVQPLGHSRVEVAYRRTFTPAEAERLRWGLWPQDMDDRWVIFLGDSSLDMWRSWTGFCIYSLSAQTNEGSVTVGPLLINSDAAQYQRVSDEADIQTVESLIGRVLQP